MRFEAKKNLLSHALSEVKSITSVASMDADETKAPAIRVRATKKGLKISSTYAEATVADAVIAEEGEAVLDMNSLQQALSVSGTDFNLTIGAKDKAASFSCGRSKGKVSVRDDAPQESLMEGAPKTKISVPGFGQMLAALALKGDASERTLHIVGDVVRGESSDTFRGVTVTAVSSGNDLGNDTVSSLSIPQKTCDQLSKLVQGSKIGFNERFLTVQGAGLRAVLPLSSDPPLSIESQMKEWLGSQSGYGFFLVPVAEIKSALADAIGMIGKDLQAKLDLTVDPGTDALFAGDSQSGPVEAKFTLAKSKVTTKAQASVSAGYLRECLDFYKTPSVRVALYDAALVLGFPLETDSEQIITNQTTVIPLLSPLAVAGKPVASSDDDEGEDGDDDEPAEASGGEEAEGTATEDSDDDEGEEEETPPPLPVKAPKKPRAAAKAPEEEEGHKPPKAKKAAKAADDDDEEEAPPQPVVEKKAAAKKKAEPVAAVEEEEEEFDDEE